MAFIDAAITTTFAGTSSPALAGPGARRHLILATFPFGPDYPMDLPAAQAAQVYGSPVDPASDGYTGPGMVGFGNVQSPDNAGAINYVIARVGVVRTGVRLLDTAGATSLIVNGVGAYAGTRGQGLRLSVANPTGTKVTSVTVTNSAGTILLQITDSSVTGGRYTITSVADIINYINAANPLGSPASVVQASVGTSSLLPVDTSMNPGAVYGVSGPQPLTGGSDGKGALSSDSTIAGLLTASLNLPVNFISVGWDGMAMASTILSHLNDALARNSYREAFLGPAKGTLYSALSSGSYTTVLSSSRVVMDAHDSWTAVSPATGAFYPYDGFYHASAAATRKAMMPPEATLMNEEVQGFTYINPPVDQPAGLTDAQRLTLQGVGLMVSRTLQYQDGIRIKEGLTTLPQTSALTGQTNLKSEIGVQDIDDTVAAAIYRGTLPYQGKPYAPDLPAKIHDDVQAELSGLGTTINGVNSITVTFDANAQTITVAVSYITRVGVRNINIVVSSTTS